MKKLFFLLFRSFILRIFFKFNYTLRKTVKEKKILLEIKNLKIYKTNHQLIRLGESGDGGYLVPDDLSGITACFTGGVGPMIKFEHDLAIRGIKCFMADYSVNNLPSPIHSKFFFTKKFLGTQNNNIYINCNQWLSENTKDNEDYIFKIDIEGDEYKILLNITEEHLLRMRMIIFEIHDFSNILFPLGFEIIKSLFDKLLKHHSIVHISPNNVSPAVRFSKKLTLYDQLEITLLRNDRISYKEYAKNFPHPLDSKNNNFFKSKLPDCFYLE
jgi:hypothetical protein